MTPQRFKLYIFILTFISGIFLFLPHLNYQPALATGDHGRDLYCFEAVLKGDLPYKDFWWVYGPLMPYYYGLFFRILGINIQSVLFAKFLLNLTMGMAIFLSLGLFVPLIFAYAGTLWFWVFNPDFFFTYNHIGGITLLTVIIYNLFYYIRYASFRHVIQGLITAFLLCLVKINFGVIAALLLLTIVMLTNRIHGTPFSPKQKRTLGILSAVFVFILSSVYFVLIRNLSLAEIRQCFPYLSSDHPHNAAPIHVFYHWGQAIALTINKDWPNRLFSFIIIMSVFQTAFYFNKPEVESAYKKKLLMAVLSLIFFYFLNIHEFLMSGVLYRAAWSQPFSILMIFFFIGLSAKGLSKTVRILLFGTFFLIISLQNIWSTQGVQLNKNPLHFLDFKKGQIYTGNDPSWNQIIRQTVGYLQENVGEQETFLALPYDPLYYYLCDKSSPTRQLIFFEHINIPEKQEEAIIKELEKNRVNWVVISNRAMAPNPGLGIFGEDYCPLLGKYLNAEFEINRTFGFWVPTSDWIYPPGVRILKRKNTLSI